MLPSRSEYFLAYLPGHYSSSGEAARYSSVILVPQAKVLKCVASRFAHSSSICSYQVCIEHVCVPILSLFILCNPYNFITLIS